MAARVIPASTVVVDLDDVMIDQLCFDHALRVLKNRRQAGQLRGYVEATLAANQDLSLLGSVLPRGTVVKLPHFDIETISAPSVRLWD